RSIGDCPVCPVSDGADRGLCFVIALWRGACSTVGDSRIGEFAATTCLAGPVLLVGQSGHRLCLWHRFVRHVFHRPAFRKMGPIPELALAPPSGGADSAAN